MAINKASKYASKVDERFSQLSVTENIGLNTDYDWNGVATVTVYGAVTGAMNDYSRTGTSRYGTPGEIQDTKKDYTVTKDRAFSLTIDRGNNDEQMQTKESGKVLARQLREVVVPELDIYRLAVWAAAAVANGKTAIAAITASNAYVKFLDAQEALDNALVPMEGRICFCTPKFYNFMKQDTVFVKACDMAQKMVIKGVVGEIDGVRLIKVPSNYLPAGAAFMILHPGSCVAVKKLNEYKTHVNPPGISGALIEGRIIHDAFILDNKKDAVFFHKIA